MDQNLPEVIKKDQLLKLDKDGSECEACRKHMYDHEWALMDKDGFVLYCSNCDKPK